MTHSAIYEGAIRHRRFSVRKREFRHRIAMAYVDLDELPRLLGGRLVARRPGLVRFRRDDYLGDPAIPLDRAVRELVAERSGAAPAGPIRLLTHLRTFGHCFNPVSFYYCFAADGERLEAVVAEVTNTPWGERHAYVLGGDPTKALHVSPFMGMEQRYEEFECPAGSFIYIPAGTPHGFRVGPAPSRKLNLYTPAAMLGYFDELSAALARGAAEEELALIAERHGMQIIGPVPEGYI